MKHKLTRINILLQLGQQPCTRAQEFLAKACDDKQSLKQKERGLGLASHVFLGLRSSDSTKTELAAVISRGSSVDQARNGSRSRTGLADLKVGSSR